MPDWKLRRTLLIIFCAFGIYGCLQAQNLDAEKEKAENARRAELKIRGVRISTHSVKDNVVREQGALFRQKDYDEKGRIIRDAFMTSAGNLLFFSQMKYNSAAQRSSMVYYEPSNKGLDSTLVTILWDSKGQKKCEFTNRGSAAPDSSFYTYDSSGRWIQKQVIPGDSSMAKPLSTRSYRDGKLIEERTVTADNTRFLRMAYDGEGRLNREILIGFDKATETEFITGITDYEYRRDGLIRKTMHRTEELELMYERRYQYIKLR